jgi:hypothetical protein
MNQFCSLAWVHMKDPRSSHEGGVRASWLPGQLAGRARGTRKPPPGPSMNSNTAAGPARAGHNIPLVGML